MRNIILIGSSRSGKTTFSNMIKNKYNEYNIFHGDMIKKAYQDFKKEDASSLKQNKEYRKFIKNIFYYHTKLDNSNYILETVDLFPEDIKDLDRNQYLIIAFGCISNSQQELINIWNEIDNSWLKNKKQDELFNKANKVINNSLFIKEECEKYNIKFVDTSYNRKEILNNLIDEI